MPEDVDLIVRWWITRPEGWEDLILAETEKRSADRRRPRSNRCRPRATSTSRSRATCADRRNRRRVSNTSRRFKRKMTHCADSCITSRNSKSSTRRSSASHARTSARERPAPAAQGRLAKSSKPKTSRLTLNEHPEHVRDLALEDRRSALANLGTWEAFFDLHRLGQRQAVPPHEQARQATSTANARPSEQQPQGMTIHLLKSTATVIITATTCEGHMAKPLTQEQRELLIAATEQLAARFGTHLSSSLMGLTSQAPIERIVHSFE